MTLLQTLIEIEQMRSSHIESIVKLQREGDLSIWSEADYNKQIINPQTINLVALYDNQIIGFIISSLLVSEPLLESEISTSKNKNENKNENELEILNFSVAAKFRNRKVGTILLNTLIKKSVAATAGTLWLEVRESNEKGRRFYKRRGFGEIYVRKNYYRNPSENAVVMKLKLFGIKRQIKKNQT